MTTLVDKNVIQKRRENQRITKAIFDIDNLKSNPATQHIIDDYVNGKTATIDDAIKQLDEHYKVAR